MATLITSDQAHEMSQPFLKSADKKRLGITGFQNVSIHGWSLKMETEMAFLLTGINEEGSYCKREYNDASLWLPKSQTKVFEYIDDELLREGYTEEEAKTKIFFVKTWLYNQEKSSIKLNHFENHSY